ncbi:hypothetical protein GUJ93_ZPchr0001g32159 [Zizania palustris]|uniref:Uncharacterized protein n=1 Tax=Zizania palustris TaxID=103762 RepID=A0A8J5VC62_ZIZPA|nr:hypothetical protein GUJ93_ZPchr0001g32159 [Zizania palustris]
MIMRSCTSNSFSPWLRTEAAVWHMHMVDPGGEAEAAHNSRVLHGGSSSRVTGPRLKQTDSLPPPDPPAETTSARNHVAGGGGGATAAAGWAAGGGVGLV